MSLGMAERLRTRSGGLAVASLLFVVSVAGACGDSAEVGGSGTAQASTTAGPAGGPATEASVTNVRVHRVEQTAFHLDARYAGEVRPARSVTLSAELPGRLVHLGPAQGDRVRQGQVVARVDGRVANLSAVQAEGAVAAARDRLERITALRAEDLASPADLAQAQAALAQAEAGLSQAQAQAGRTVVRSPLSGLVVRRAAEPGEFVSPGKVLLEVADFDNVDVSVRIPESRIRYIAQGAAVRVTVPARPELGELPGTVRLVGWVGDEDNRTYPVDVRLDNKDTALRSGMLALVDVRLLELSEALVVRRDWVVDTPQGPLAYVVQGDSARARPVQLGQESEGRAVVRKGIEVGDQLIVVGHRQVVDGDRVRILEERPAPELKAAR